MEEQARGTSHMNESQQRRPTFIHSSEETFAQILDYYGIQWEYEPRAFPLRWDDQGHVIEAFTPDFYLPGQNLYVELTTLRPRLITIKNRKLRRLKALYPDINIKLLRRQDLRDMMVKYGMDREAARIAGTKAQKEEP
jgi:hypoxanthine phosphoribosyltransferase